MFSEEQIKGIKEQLIEQIKNFPEEKREGIKNQIESMNSQDLESFLRKNNLIQTNSESQIIQNENNNCIFCSIISGEINSYKIGEDKESIAILELNPMSRGHTLIVPKEHNLEEIGENVKKFSEEISEKIKEGLSPKEIKLFATEILGHKIINILPIYEDDFNSERKKASEEELKELKEILENVSKKKKEKNFDTVENEHEKEANQEKNKKSEDESKKEENKQEKSNVNQEPEITDKNTWLPIRIP